MNSLTSDHNIHSVKGTTAKQPDFNHSFGTPMPSKDHLTKHLPYYFSFTILL